MDELRDEGAEELPEAPPTRRKRLFLAIGCALLVVLGCCGSCVLFVLGGKRHQRDLFAFTPPPAIDPETESDAGWRHVAVARRAATSPTCEGYVVALRSQLRGASREDVVAFHEFLRARAADADTQGLRDACSAAFHGVCNPARFLTFRMSLITLGHATFDAALGDADTLAPVLDPEPSCDGMTWVALAALRDGASAVDAGVAPPVDAGALDSRDGSVDADTLVDERPSLDATSAPGPIRDAPPTGNEGEPAPLATTTRTEARGRLDLPDRVPHLCARFSCSLGDVFD